MTIELAKKKCIPCEGGVDKLNPEQVNFYMTMVQGWRVDGDRIAKRYVFKDFLGAMAFLNRVASAAEEQGHHPDFCVHYNQVDVTLWTHAIGGLSENDFILAAVVDGLVED
ncbi:MAG TPA: 4a-hydroxytetrahydrobiopterin dehydratase [Polyangiaceae bacterium]|jgi:4a-hydroxytetrahydrobiopterin dehydratase|nr:MAG: putative pterin-4-alpha-carbinolamine dehydratase [Deltaproteobacteria bacterium ADurb.Bin207]HNS96334.1 4a-hydroxytetrahydrobiopterin dehydratase [Polyangiaceae bacterium]HNZ24266.1 4a-hydroxytetrahydrobiopterin dehydratase [Polyangiaceae bacterium]HOD24813.1 4a-hydroxytetrahydrobiopterin dehydratase [Polyangiaceae bacterium]HOE49687.1 4a-hydroxytetrahydrobiopterin dehydratase [Polyangiaceae bacterium]